LFESVWSQFAKDKKKTESEKNKRKNKKKERRGGHQPTWAMPGTQSSPARQEPAAAH
jgi:hypothetical protein